MDTKIRLSKGYYLCSDDFCCWINRERLSKDGKIREERVAGYSPNLQALFFNFADKIFRDTESKTAKKYMKEIAQKEEEIKDFIKEVYNEQRNNNGEIDKRPRTKRDNKRK